jgi:hypothetical protein
MPTSRGSPRNNPKPEFTFRFFFTKIEANGEPACKRAFIVALTLVLVFGLPIATGLAWRVATGDLSIIPITLGKAFSGISVRSVSREYVSHENQPDRRLVTPK